MKENWKDVAVLGTAMPIKKSAAAREMTKRLMKSAVVAATALGLSLGPVAANAAMTCKNETWNKIMERHKLVVGVKPDYKPWGFRDRDGKLVGMEADMGQMVGDILGASVELVPVQSSNRMQFLEQGKIDVMIATMSDRPDRRKIVGAIQPNYYTSGTNVLAPKAIHLKTWTQLKGKPVCGKQGAFYNKIVADRYGAKIIAFVGNAEAKQALRDKKCIAWVFDDSSIMSDLASGEWNDYEMPLKSEDDNPWALAVPKAEQHCIFGNFMSGLIFNWHQDGTLIALEKKWKIQPTEYLKNMHARYADWLAGQK
jgi:polar amino acid transport system substrate-binding protein